MGHRSDDLEGTAWLKEGRLCASTPARGHLPSLGSRAQCFTRSLGDLTISVLLAVRCQVILGVTVPRRKEAANRHCPYRVGWLQHQMSQWGRIPAPRFDFKSTTSSSSPSPFFFKQVEAALSHLYAVVNP